MLPAIAITIHLLLQSSPVCAQALSSASATQGTSAITTPPASTSTPAPLKGAGKARVPKHLPAYSGKTKTSTEPLIAPNSNSSGELSPGASPGTSADPFSDSYSDPTKVPLPNTSRGAGDVSDADLAPGPIIRNPKIQKLSADDGSEPALDPSARSFVRLGIQGGETLTSYRQIQSGSKEGALALGAQMGLAVDWWDHLQLFGIPLSGEENLRLDYVTSLDSGLAQMVETRLDSVLLFGTDTDLNRSILPLFGLGIGWASAELKSTANTTPAFRLETQGALISATIGARWRFTQHAALDLTVEPVFFTSHQLSNFGKINGLLGLVLFF